MSERENTLRVLNEGHTFPGPFMFKVIGENSPEFVARVIQAATIITGPAAARALASAKAQVVSTRP